MRGYRLQYVLRIVYRRDTLGIVSTVGAVGARWLCVAVRELPPTNVGTVVVTVPLPH